MSLLKRIDKYNAAAPTELYNLKMAALQESPFRFYRGTCHLFAEDLRKVYHPKTSIMVWNCGDAHFENFGSYKGDNRQVYFDLDDFDESFLGSPVAELTRFMTSIVIAGMQMGTTGVHIHKAINDILQTYVSTIQKRKALMLEAEVAPGAFKKFFSQMSTLNREDFIARRTIKEKGLLKLKIDDKRYMPLEESKKKELFKSLSPLITKNARFSEMVFEDAAVRIAGTGSLGQERYCILFYSKRKGKQYLVDVKESRQSSYSGLSGSKQPKFRNEAERIINTGHIMQFTPPAFIAPLRMGDKWFVVKELQPTADRMALDSFDKDFHRLTDVAIEMSKLIAYAHIRGCGNYGASTVDELINFTAKKQWQRDVVDLSGMLALKNNKYYKTFCAKKA